MTPDKLAAWLSEDILLRRTKPRKPRRRQRRARPEPAGPATAPAAAAAAAAATTTDAEALAEVKSLAAALEVPLAEVASLLADDREGYVPPVALAPALEQEQEQEPDPETEGSLYTKSTVDAYVAAVIELWRLQVAHGNTNVENPRGPAVRGFLDQRGRQRGRLDRANFKDRGHDGIQAGYSPEEWLRIQDNLLNGSAYTPQSLRTRVDLLFGHYYLLRGENRRKMELADLSLLEYPAAEGPTSCNCLVSLLQDGKMNQTARKEFMGSLRHKDPLLCTQGALAQLFFWRWHIAGEEPPSFRRRRDWYKIKVLVGQDREQELSYPTQLQETWKALAAAGVASVLKTHLPRSSGSQHAENKGAAYAQISQAGRWAQSILVKAYLTHLPREFMRIVAGFTASAGDYFLARAAHEPPHALQKQLWPWIEEWEARFEARARRCSWEEGGLDEDDLAADGFLKLMRHLRVVLLQDLAVLQPRYPNLPFFAYAPFHGPEWDEYALRVQTEAAGVSEPHSLLLQRALPELSNVLQSTREAILQSGQRLATRLESQVRGLQSSLEGQVQGLKSGLDALVQGQVPITFTGYFGAGPGPAPVPVPVPVPVSAAAAPATGPAPAAAATAQGPPVFAALAKAYTVKDVWREWDEGLGGRPAIRELEEQWGSSWRPGNTVRVQYCRRKVIWDELLARTARGKSQEEAVAELEQLRAGQSLNQLVDKLKQRRQYRSGSPGLSVVPGVGGRGSGRGRRGRWARWGQRGGVHRQQAVC